jgi:hypothetical protein
MYCLARRCHAPKRKVSTIPRDYRVNDRELQLKSFLGTNLFTVAVDSIHKNYDKVVVENTSPLDQSYMFFLFYLKVDPSYYQSLGGTKTAGFREIHKGFYNYVFEPVRETKEQGKLLLIGKPSDILDRSTNSKTIYYPDGTPAISIGEK